ncbi:MAG: formate/nitrite transporter family protein [Thermoanaerobaculia bacterium]
MATQSRKKKEKAPEPEEKEERLSNESLNPSEKVEARKRTALRAHVVHAAILSEGEEELRRPSASLAYSGFAAGLSMGFSLVAEGLLKSHLPDAEWTPLLTKLGYSVGFLIVILGRQQLFTEKTLTAILPLLEERKLNTLTGVARLWAIVLFANLLGAMIFAVVLSRTELFDPDVNTAFVEIARAALSLRPSTAFLSAIFAGWLIALMVWLLPYADTARVGVIVIITYLVGLGGFNHIIAGSVSVMYLLASGAISWSEYLLNYAGPTLAGNIVGGVALVAVLGHAQVRQE